MSEITLKPDEQNDFLSRPLLAAFNLDWEKAIYIIFILIAIVTRFWDLGSRVMSHDESLHTQFSYQFFIGDGYNHTALMHGPFLFHITAVSYWLFGDNDMAARLPVALFGVVLIALPYLLRHWIGRKGALFASFFFLISPYITYYSRYIRHDIYVITWALIVFFSIWYYLRERQEKYLWWFAAGTALMFSTKEVAFIYVAIFGSFLILRLISQIWDATWFRQILPNLRTAFLVLIVALLVVAGSLAVDLLRGDETTVSTTTEATDEGFAADPEQDITAVAESSNNKAALGWIQVAGLITLSVGLIMIARQMRPYIDNYPEFDLIILFTTLILPSVSPLLTTLVGQNPLEYNIPPCVLEGQETMTALQIFLARVGQAECWQPIFNTSIIYSVGFLLLTIITSILVGLWWHQRRWTISAIIFYSIFTLLFTSVFTNPEGWASGAIGSLGYWLEQQEVARGNQPEFYYFFVVTFYEFLPLTFALLAIRHWLRQNRINQLLGHWLTIIIISLLTFSLVNWWYGQPLLQIGQIPSQIPGIIVAIIVFIVSSLIWFIFTRKRILQQQEMATFLKATNREAMFSFIPSVIWWFLLTWVAYSYAGEKMPWLSTHFVIPMAFLGGWYLNDKLSLVTWPALFSQKNLLLLGLTLLLAVTAFVAIGPIFLGTIELGNQTAGNLTGIGRFLGSVVAVGGVLYLWLRQANRQLNDLLLIRLGAILLLAASFVLAQDSTLFDTIIRWVLRLVAVVGLAYSWWQSPKEHNPILQANILLTTFILLSLLTIRFTYMANYVNADYTTEYLVYAHGAPATKTIVLDQVEELSMRIHGDKGIRVAYDNDVSWPFTWYLRDYPNRHYFGASPSNTITESPVLIVGRASWDKVEPFLGNNYETREYTFLWWPMEEYRKMASWNAIFGDPSLPENEQRGLGNINVRQALWNIFFYRDYTKYGEVFGGNYTTGEWPLRHDLRLYIRKDVLANLWDYGLGATAVAEDFKDPYEENVLTLEPIMVLGGSPGVENGQFTIPRNVAIAPDGTIYIADSGNHRVQAFDPEGNFLTSWGSFGSEAGQFNEPWGIVADETAVYVADTWNHRIQKFALDGTWLTSFGISGSPTEDETGLGLFFGPRSLTLLPDNRLLVTDTGNHRMQMLDRDGQFLAQIGSAGAALGFLNEPVGLATGSDGSVYLADTWNGRIQKFSPDLIAQEEWRVNAWTSQNIGNKPYIAVDSQARVYVTDPEGYRVLVFDESGTYLAQFGTFGIDLSSFALPNGIAIDAQDNIYIADADNNRVLKFAPIFDLELEPEADIPANEADSEAEEANNDNAADNKEEALPTPTESGE